LILFVAFSKKVCTDQANILLNYDSIIQNHVMQWYYVDWVDETTLCYMLRVIPKRNIHNPYH